MDALTRISATLVIVAILGLFWWLSRKHQSVNIGALKFSFGQPRESSAETHSLALVARRRITASHELHLVKALGQNILICTSPSGAAVLLAHQAAEPDSRLPS
jgi:hypothetical protein